MSDITIAINAKNNASGALKSVEGELNNVGKAGKEAGASLAGIGKNLSSVGKGLTAAITLPLVGVGAAAIKAATDLNKSMANIQSLGVAQVRVNELKTAVQDMAIATGKSTSDLAGGLYQVISAFGDTSDTAKILEINAKSAAAGLATTTDAINLTSAVTKGYGDTSAGAVQAASDLALKTVQLGQTTFPELAASIGKVVPLSASLGVSQKELFAVFATGTGVTGGAAEVATQYRGILQSLMVPTEQTSKLQKALGFSSGEAMLKQLGLEKSIQVLVSAAKATNQPLQSFIGSIEGQTLALALAGPQAATYEEKLKAMAGAAGATDEAFKAQTQGVNKMGFTMEQARIKMEVFLQKLGDALAPALGTVFDLVTPLADKLLGLANSFSQLDPSTQKWIIGIAAAAAAIGPMLMAIGSLLPMLGTMGAALGALVSPLGLVAAGLGALVYFNFDSIKEFSTSILGGIVAAAPSAGAALGELVAQFTGIGINAYDTTEGIQSFVTALTGSQSAGMAAAGWVELAATAFRELTAQLTGVGLSADDGVIGIQNFVTALTGSQSAGIAVSTWIADIGYSLGEFQTTIVSLFSGPLARLQDSFTTFGSSLGQLGPQFSALGSSIVALWTASQPALSGLAQIMGIALGALSVNAINVLSATFQNAGTIIGAVVSQITATINFLTTTISGMTTIITSLVNGDFSGAWTGAQTIISGFVTYASTSLSNFSATVGGVLGIVKTTITSTLSDLGFTEISTQIDTISAKVSGGWLSIKDNVTIAVASFKWSDFITPLTDWGKWVISLDWKSYIAALTSWGEFIAQIEWSGFITAVNWGSYIASLSWDSFVSALSWTSIVPTFSWSSFITSIDLGSYIPAFPGWGSLMGAIGLGGSSEPAKRASGDSSFKGGWSWVGENGPELMRLPRGTQILSNAESNRYIANNADGTTTAAAAGSGGLGLTGAMAAGFNKYISSAMESGGDKAGKKIAKAMERQAEQQQQKLEGALQKVPGLFGSSEVTQKQMDMAKLGIPQNFADDYLRHLTDTVLNGKKWDGVDIKDAAQRAGIDPTLPAKVILDMVKEKWNDQSLFAEGKNTDLINMDAVRESIKQQQAQASGKATLMALFGIKPDEAVAQGGQLLDLLNQGISKGLSGGGEKATGKGGASAGTGLGSAIVAGAINDIKSSSTDVGGQLAGALNTQLASSEAFGMTGQAILQKIVASWGDATKSVDMLAGIAGALLVQIDSKDSIETLKNIGGRIAQLLKQGIDDYFANADIASSVGSNLTNSNPPPTPGSNAIGTSSFAGGLTWVGETGPELVVLPSRTGIYPQSQVTQAQPNITHVWNVTVTNDIDVQALAYKVSQVQQQRRR